MTSEQEKAFARVNDKWPIGEYHEANGVVNFTCDDGDKGLILKNGTVKWTHLEEEESYE